MLRPGRAQVVEEYPAAVLIGVEVDGIAADGALCVGIDVTAADGTRRTGRQEMQRIAFPQVLEQLRSVCAGSAAVVDAPATPTVRIVVESRQ